jgi:aminopeptidase N
MACWGSCLVIETARLMRCGAHALTCIATVSVLALSRLAVAQEPRPYRPAFDVVDYALTIDLPDTGSTIRANAVLSVARTGKSDTLTLDLLDLAVDRVTVDGRLAKFTRTPETVAIPVPKKGNGAHYTVSIDYGGMVTDGLIVRMDSAGRWTYFGDNWPNRARHWIPSIDHPSDKATVTWRVRAPAGRTVVANGRLVSTQSVRDGSGAQRIESVWRESRRIPVYLMVIAAAPLEQFDLGDTDCGLAELQRCVPQSVYTAPEQRGFLPGPFARAGEIVQLFSNLVGPFPYEKLSHLQSSTRFGGMENASEIFYSDAGFRNRSMTDQVVAHETAHQWFGDAVTERDWPHLWLSEGFATYFAALWTRAARGDSAFRVQMAGVRDAVLSDTIAVPKRPVIDTLETNLLALLNRNSYEKGGFVLHMLRGQVGERAFFDAIHSYYAKHRHATAVTDDLRAEMEGASKQSLGWFFDQWLRRPGYPEVTATWTYDAGTHKVVITVAQSARFGAFRFPLAIAAVDSTGAVHRTTVQILAADGGAQQVRIPLAAAPASVALDPDVELLAALKVVHE